MTNRAAVRELMCGCCCSCLNEFAYMPSESIIAVVAAAVAAAVGATVAAIAPLLLLYTQPPAMPPNEILL